MKNAQMRWKTYREPGIPDMSGWSTREQRRYYQRQLDAIDRREAKREANQPTLHINLTPLIMIIVGIIGACGNRWCCIAFALWAVYISFRPKDSKK